MTDQPNTDLLPCPFCGGEAEITESLTKIDPDRQFKAQCNSRMSTCPINARSHYTRTPEEAAEQWNTRADLAPMVKPLPDKGLLSSQPCSLNDELNNLRLKAFKSNSAQDRNEYFETLSLAFQRGDLVAHELVTSALTLAPITPAQAAKVLSEAMLNGLDPFDVTENLEMESLAIQYAGNRGDAVVTLEIAEKFMKAALKAIAEEG